MTHDPPAKRAPPPRSGSFARARLDEERVDDTLWFAFSTIFDGRSSAEVHMRAYWAIPLRMLGAATAIACSSNGTGTGGQPSDGGPSPSSVPADDGGPSTDTNPDGIPYPSPAMGFGRNKRSGTTAGSVMNDFKFLGYRDGIVSAQLTRIALADYYDPCSKRYKLIHLSVASVWCVPCNQETDAMVAAKAQLATQGIVVLQAIADGPIQGTGATTGDLNRWISSHHANFTELLDPGLTQLSGFFDAAAVPWNSDLDPRTMEIVEASTGWAGDINSELAPALQALAIDAAGNVKSAPAYPVTATCN
jgi:hypothetical protein